MELYREVQQLQCGTAPPELERLLQRRGPFWGRQYYFYTNGRPLTLISEVFSPSLEQYLGPAAAAAAAAG